MDVQGAVPLVSVVIPCRDHARELRRCLAAIAPQRESSDFEVVVLNSGSDDDVEAATRPYSFARVVRSAENLLPGAARNLGAAHAGGTYLCFLDADCTPEPGWIEAAVNALEGGAKLVGGAVLDGDPCNAVAAADNLLQFVDLAERRPPGPARLLPTCNLALRRKDFEASGGFPPTSFAAGEDTLFCIQASDRWGGQVRFAPSMRVRHFGRTSLREFAVHQELFGYVRALYALELRPIHLRLGRFAPLLPAVVFKRVFYISRRTWAWNRSGLFRRTRLLPLLLYGLAAWARGFRRGCIDRARDRAGAEVVERGVSQHGK